MHCVVFTVIVLYLRLLARHLQCQQASTDTHTSVFDDQLITHVKKHVHAVNQTLDHSCMPWLSTAFTVPEPETPKRCFFYSFISFIHLSILSVYLSQVHLMQIVARSKWKENRETRNLLEQRKKWGRGFHFHGCSFHVRYWCIIFPVLRGDKTKSKRIQSLDKTDQRCAGHLYET